MESEPRTLQLGQTLIVGVKWIGNDDRPRETHQGQLPDWQSNSPRTVSCVPSSATPGAAECQGLRLGDADLIVSGTFADDDGIYTAQQRIKLTVTDRDIPRGEIVLSYGSIQPLP